MKRAPARKQPNATASLARAAKRAGQARFTLRLYVSGTTPQSQRAVINLKRICDQHLAGRFTLEIIDVYQAPRRAREDQIIAAPTLIKAAPLPLRQLLGDLSDEERVLRGLGIVA